MIPTENPVLCGCPFNKGDATLHNAVRVIQYRDNLTDSVAPVNVSLLRNWKHFHFALL